MPETKLPTVLSLYLRRVAEILQIHHLRAISIPSLNWDERNEFRQMDRAGTKYC